MIAVNWGTTNFRAYRLHRNGVAVDSKSLRLSILEVGHDDFYEALLVQVGDWIIDGEDRILMCGMVGSRQGWMEVPYVPAPAGLQEIALGVLHFDVQKNHIGIVPGISAVDRGDAPEVMRGEETEILGIMSGGFDGTICLPGTHTKWATIRESKVERFETYMTGELYATLRDYTILGRSMGSDVGVVMDAFREGLCCAEREGGLLHHLFSARTLVLAGKMPENVAASYLSGLLIGSELHDRMPTDDVHLVGATELCSLYAEALRVRGVTSSVEPANADARGLAVVGRVLGWI